MRTGRAHGDGDIGRGAARPWALLLGAQGLALATLIAFAPTLNGEFLGWDDTAVLVNNPHYRGLGAAQLRWMFSTYHAGHYQPLTWITYAVDHLVWGTNPLGYHLTSNLLHAVNAVLVAVLALMLLRRALPDIAARRPRALDLGAAMVALLFALHPLRVESVAWLTERRDLVCGLFVLLTVMAYLRSASARGRRRAAWLGASLVLYVLSMLGKIGGAPLPVVLLVMDWYPLRRLRLGRPGGGRGAALVLLEKVPYLVIALGFSVATLAQQSGRYMLPLAEHGAVARLAQAAFGLGFYATRTLLPLGLRPVYELPAPLDPLETRFVLAALVVLVAAAAALAARRPAPAVLAAALCYAAMLGPVLGFFQNGPQLVADRYSYLATLPLALLIAGIAARQVDRRPGRAGAVLVAAAAVTLVLAALTWRQCRVWQSSAALWAEQLRRDPESYFGHNGWGMVLRQRGRAGEAAEHFRRATSVRPGYFGAWYNLWEALERLGDGAGLTAAHRRAIESAGPDVVAAAHVRLGERALQLGQTAGAIEHLAAAAELEPASAAAHRGLGAALRRAGRLEESVPPLRRAVELDPLSLEAALDLARSLQALGRRAEASIAWRTVRRLDPLNEEARGN